MLCLKKRRTYSFTQGACVDLPRRSKKDAARYEGSLNMAITTLPRKNRSREERPSGMVLTVTEDTPADMLAGSMELLVQLPREHRLNAQRVTVQRSTPMMDLLVQIATAHKLAASSYTLQAIGERGSILPHQPNTPIGALDALQVKLLPKQCTFVPKKSKPANQPFETTFRLQVHLPRNQLYVSRVSPKMNLGEILNEVCREKNLDKHKYELRHPVNLEEILDLSLSLQDYHLQEVTLYAKQGRTLGSALSSQDIMALQRQEERRRQQAKQSVFGFMFKKSKESSVSTDSLEGRSVSPARSDETGRSASPLQPPTRPQRKRRLAPKPPTSYDREQQRATTTTGTIATTARGAAGAAAAAAGKTNGESSKEKMLIGHSRNSSDSSGYHEASVLSDNPDSAGRLPETLPRRNRTPGTNETPRKLVHTSQSSKSLGNLAVTASGTSLDRALSSSSLSSTGLKKKRAAPPPPVSRPLSSAISTQALERIDDSEESLTSDMDPSKPPSDIGAPSKASSDIGVSTIVLDKADRPEKTKKEKDSIRASDVNVVEDPPKVENARVEVKREKASSEELAPLPKPRKVVRPKEEKSPPVAPPVPKRRLVPVVAISRSPRKDPLGPSSNANATKTNAEDAVRCSFSSSSSGGIEFEARDAELSEMDGSSNLLTKHAKSMNDIYNVDSSLYKSCTVISTIPKCDRFEISRNSRSSSCGRLAEDRVKDRRERSEERTSRVKDDYYEGDLDDVSGTKDDEIREDSSKGSKRSKVYRSPSESNDFQIDSFNKRKRHLTSQSKDIAFALNLNLTFESKKESDVEKESGRMERANAVDGISDVERKVRDTDALLHKVSETLSSSSLASSLASSNEETENADPAVKRSYGESRRAETEAEEEEEEEEEPPGLDGEERKNQQDTSDYVSALEEDSSVADWEYRLPAPPSAFRDTDSSLFDGYDTITLRSVEAFKESLDVENRDDGRNDESFGFRRIDEGSKSKRMESRKTETEVKFKKEVISELETKIERGTLARSQREPDSRKVFSGTSTLTSNFAPVDNTLSNFTITTYTRQKSIDIFKENEDKSSLGDEPSRNKKTEPKISNDVVESTRVWQSANAKAGIVKRSKSHASAMSKPVKSNKNEAEGPRVDASERSANVGSDVAVEDTAAPRDRVNDGFATRWRDNVSRNRQEEPTKGRELRSLQVLKSILPQLTSSQPAEENASKERNAVTREKAKTRFVGASDQDSVTPSVLSSRGECHATARRENKEDSMQRETSAKRRYAYNGPPAISLGSWAERPSFKVQIKTDTDYKFQRDRSADGATTSPSSANNSKDRYDKRDADDLASKLVVDKAVSAFKRATFDKTIAPESKSEERPVVTSFELKKTVVREKEDTVKSSTRDEKKDDENLIDTTPLNFQELTKAFRTDIEHRTKPQRSNATNGRSDCYGSQHEFVRKTLDPKKQNGQPTPDEFSFKRNLFQKDNASVNGNRNANPNSEGHQFGSIVGINSLDRRHRDQIGQRSDNVSFRNNANGTKAHPMTGPVVKGFKVSTTPFKQSKGINVDKVDRNKEVVEALPPKAPTMPVIMGVTLKSANARPKSMPISVDSRDMLLESIRNFGGRGKLKNTAERY
ncbi:uncharacterized protein LOC122634452 isoform X3 [Vespula pensylvanica]|uniref:uncharacterized protein LOC122634452 isoform X3 n=1 Tax=Vespula pensylvanica TaxID=30213 RepID=UPI001CBA00C4|nr:uncharacterized protein LOC122634452 isoform X3 [Vespula pensylvanica]